MTEAELLVLIRERFPEPAYALLPHVAEATGDTATRTADAIAMSVWPSRGLEMLGFECKSSRADWVRELRNPAKAEGIAKYMDRWWLVVADKAFVHPGELPPTWGLLAVVGGRLKVQVDAPKLDPKPLNRSFLAAVLRSAARKLVEPDGVQDLLRVEYNRGVRDGERVGRQVGLGHTDRAEDMAKAIAAFKAESGIDIGARTWEAGKIGAAVRFLVDHDGWASVLGALESVANADERLHEALRHEGLSAVPDFRAWRHRR